MRLNCKKKLCFIIITNKSYSKVTGLQKHEMRKGFSYKFMNYVTFCDYQKYFFKSEMPLCCSFQEFENLIWLHVAAEFQCMTLIQERENFSSYMMENIAFCNCKTSL